MVSDQKIRVIAFDDHASVRDMLEMLIDAEDDMLCVDTFQDCSDIFLKIEKSVPDIVIMDIQMPGINGIEGVRKIKSKFPFIKILMQTVFEDEEKIFDSVCAGASGYILKKSKAEEIVAAIRDTYNGGSPMTPVIASKVLEKFRKQNPAGTKEDFHLSGREKEILSLLVKGKSYKMIADELEISYHTVDSHIRKIYEKLHVHSMTEAVTKAIEKRIV